LPTTPAVYIFVDSEGTSLYIGKSIHLRTRVKQHYQESQKGSKPAYFWTKATRLTYFEVSSALEADLLEARLIRLYQPQYNAISKDDKSSLYITISQDNFPRVKLARKTELTSKVTYYGPFMSAHRTQQILRLARRIFRFCANPPRGKSVSRPCFYYHLNLCQGACVGKISPEEYRRQIGWLKRFLNGQTRTVMRRLLREIKSAAKQEDFRQAERLKQAYESLLLAQTSQRLGGSFLEGNPQVDRQLGRLVQVLASVGIQLQPERIECFDMATLQQKQTVGSMVVFSLGVADKSQYRRFRVQQLAGGDPHNMAEVIRRRFRHSEWALPGLVILDGGKGQLSVAGAEVPSSVPVIALAKQEEVIYLKTTDGFREIRLAENDPALSLCRAIRDEAHRFATGYHTKIRRRELIKS
jgi:excinuclease ABC subunit C